MDFSKQARELGSPLAKLAKPNQADPLRPLSRNTRPLPSFSWANGTEVWNCMLEKDSAYSKSRTHRMLERHPALVDTYRTVLFDWLSEVSHECKFHRETYHLALDFIDRYLSAQANVGKLQLQLIGTTCLFVAAKFEEIRPPTVTEFADLTDGACRPEDIIDNEVVILSAINWEITPVTANNWLNMYMQILLNLDKQQNDQEDQDEIAGKSQKSQPVADENLRKSDCSLASKNDSFILPTTNGIFTSKYKRIASVIDLALLHIESLRFSNSILTAAALYYFTDELTVRQCTGYDLRELATCVRWLKPFVETINEIREPVFLANFNGYSQSTQLHTHIATARLLEKVFAKMMADEANRTSLKRKAYSISEEEITDSDTDSLLLATTQTSTLLTPPKREPLPSRKTRRMR